MYRNDFLSEVRKVKKMFVLFSLEKMLVQFAPQRSLPVLGSPEKSPTGVAGDGSVVLANFNIFNEAD